MDNSENPASQSEMMVLRSRFGARLRSALDQIGLPVMRLERARALGLSIGVDATIANQYLSGLHLPDYQCLLSICRLTNKSPGFFLDAQWHQFPSGTMRARCIEHEREDLAFALPWHFIERHGVPDQLYYLFACESMGFGIHAGDTLIVGLPDQQNPLRSGYFYLVYDDPKITLARCLEVTHGRARFVSDGHSIDSIVPLSAAHRSAEDDGASGIYVVIGVLRSDALLGVAQNEKMPA